MNSVEELIREKLQAALESEKRRVASGLITGPPSPPPQPVKEAFSHPGRPQEHKPSENAGERRQKKQLQIMKAKQRLAQLQQQAAKSSDAKGMNAKMMIARTKLSLLNQELTAIK